jgi:hypothetical protein
MSENIKNEEELSLEKAEEAAKKLEKAIQKETEKFNKKIKKLGEGSGLNLETEISIIFK